MARPKRAPSDDPQKLLAAVRDKLTAGRSMSALKDAKELRKRHPSPEAEELLAQAYAARISDLSGSGMHAEAAELVGVARERFPGREELWGGVSADAARKRGDLSDLLRRWRDEPDARNDVASELRRHLRDPASIADSDVLPADDPLRIAAAGVRRAFEQAARGGLDDTGRDALRGVGRRSPLVPWRAFVLALDAFHRGDDARCREQLAAITDEDPTARGRDTLVAAMLDREIPRDPDIARTVRRLVGTVPDAIAAAAPVMAHAMSDERWFDAAESALAKLKTVGRVPLQRFLFWMSHHCDGSSALTCTEDAGAGPRWLGRDWPRLVGLIASRAIERVTGWAAWLLDEPPLVRTLDDVELAIALEQLESLLLRFAAELDHGPARGALFAWAQQRPLSALYEQIANEPPDSAAAMHGMPFVGWVQVFEQVAERTGIAPSPTDPMARVLRQIVALHPTRARFERLLACHDPSAAAERDAVFDAWVEALPGDPEPWLLRSKDAEMRDALVTALQHLDRAEQLAPVDVRVRTARFRLALAKLRKHWRTSKRHLCVRDLEDLGALPIARTREVRWFLAGTRQLLDAGTVAAPLESEPVEEAQQRALEALVRHVLEDAALRTFGRTPAERLATAAFLARIASAIGLPLSRPPEGLGRGSTFAPSDLPTDPEDLLAICEISRSSSDHQSLRSLAAAAGLRADGPRLARFLAHHAMRLPLGSARLARCRRLARYHAARAGDDVALEMLPPARFDDGAPMTESEAAAALAEERSACAAAKPRKKTPRRKRTTQPQLPFGPGDGPSARDAGGTE